MRINCCFSLISLLCQKVHASLSSAQTRKVASKIKTQLHNASFARVVLTTTRTLRSKLSQRWYAALMESPTETSASFGRNPASLESRFRFFTEVHAQVCTINVIELQEA